MQNGGLAPVCDSLCDLLHKNINENKEKQQNRLLITCIKNQVIFRRPDPLNNPLLVSLPC
jgi:hypothetical protein